MKLSGRLPVLWVGNSTVELGVGGTAGVGIRFPAPYKVTNRLGLPETCRVQSGKVLAKPGWLVTKFRVGLVGRGWGGN